MSGKRPGHRVGTDLRGTAEARLKAAPKRAPASSIAPAEVLHELHVHQVELELQNEELRRAQAALEESRDQYLELYDFAPVGYLTLDLSGKIARINLSGAAMLGVDRAQLASRSFERFVASTDQPRWVKHLSAAREHDAPETCELLVQPAGGEPFPAQLTTVRAAAGAVGSGDVRCTIVDITDRRIVEEERERRIVELLVLNKRLEQTQRQLLQADKLAAIGQLAAGVAHEINSPLSYALTNLFLVDEYVQELFDPKQLAAGATAPGAGGPGGEPVRSEVAERDREAIRWDLTRSLAESRDGLERVTQVVRDLRIFAHPDTGRLQLANLHEVLEGALRVVAGALGPSTRVTRDFWTDELKLFCRPFQLGQVFMNVLVNAAQASPATGSITVRTGRTGAEAWVEIEDNGPGIMPENLERIFEPFFTTKPIGVGTGLGLSIAQAIVRGHGGRIEVRTKIGAGSTFRIVLPMGGEERAVQGAAGPDPWVS